jgi:hypothetical protein
LVFSIDTIALQKYAVLKKEKNKQADSIQVMTLMKNS